jgi:2-amino-4-hydroxy-6-hydroxymethyldihydropteridine diphosphokinase
VVDVYVGVGSSLNQEKNIRNILALLTKEFITVNISPIYESESVGFKGGNFYNLVVGFQTDLEILQLIKVLKQLEAEQGKINKDDKSAPRNIDLDLLLYGAKINETLNIPRDEICKNAFVLKPLSDLVPKLKHPVNGKSFQSLWNEYPQDSQKLWRLDLSI